MGRQHGIGSYKQARLVGESAADLTYYVTLAARAIPVAQQGVGDREIRIFIIFTFVRFVQRFSILNGRILVTYKVILAKFYLKKEFEI